MEHKEYNGWTNYETWAANLWLTNDEGSDSYWREQAQTVYDRTHGDAHDRLGDAQTALAGELKAYHEENADELGLFDGKTMGVFSDLLSAALDEVDWYEIAGAFLEDVERTVETE